MPSIKNALRYCSQYGMRGLIGLSWEKFVVDPYRFRTGVKRKLPDFPERKQKATTPPMHGIPCRPHLNILYLVHYFYPTKTGGTERFLLNLAKDQQSAGNHVLVITLGNLSLPNYPDHYQDIYYRKYQIQGIEVMEIRHRRAPLGLYYKAMNEHDFVMAEFSDWLLKERDVSIVHAAYPQPFISLFQECRKHNVPYVITVTDFNMLCHYSSMVDKTGQFCPGSKNGRRCAAVCKTYGIQNYEKRHETAERALLHASAVTAPSEFVARVLEKEFPKVPVSVVPHGIGGEFAKERTRSGLGAAKFVYAGTLSELKGVHLLISAFRELGGHVALDIYGDDSSGYAAKLKKAAGTNVQFHGAVDSTKMADIYRGADCVIVPSVWYETYNFVVREALSCGCLVIASRIGAMPEAVEDGKNGFLFEPGDVASLVEALRKAAEFDWNGYHHASFPTVTQEGETYSRLYDSCLPSGPLDESM